MFEVAKNNLILVCSTRPKITVPSNQEFTNSALPIKKREKFISRVTQSFISPFGLKKKNKARKLLFQFSLSLTAQHSSNSSRNPFYTLWTRLVLLTWSMNTICSKNFLIHCFDDSVSGRISAVCFAIVQLVLMQHSRTWISVWIFQETRPICLLRNKSISIVKRLLAASYDQK